MSFLYTCSIIIILLKLKDVLFHATKIPLEERRNVFHLPRACLLLLPRRRGEEGGTCWAAAAPTVSPRAAYSGRIHKYTLKCTPGWGPACWRAAETLPHGLVGQGGRVNTGLPSLARPANLSHSSAPGRSQDLSLCTAVLPVGPPPTPPAWLTRRREPIFGSLHRW